MILPELFVGSLVAAAGMVMTPFSSMETFRSFSVIVTLEISIFSLVSLASAMSWPTAARVLAFAFSMTPFWR